MKKLCYILKCAAIELLLAAALLCVFALFHHVLPRHRLMAQGGFQPISTAQGTPAPAPRDSPDPEPTPAAELPWSEKFAQYFSDETISTENSYRSKQLSLSLETVSVTQADGGVLVYHVADIYIAHIENLATAFPAEYNQLPVEYLARENGAVLAINGDYCINQSQGLLVRNGQLLLTEQTLCDICVLYYDGSLETYGPRDYIAQDIIDRQPYQVWKFGPALLGEDGSPADEFNTGEALLIRHPRAALGYYEPGHYCFVVADGRQNGYSDGASMAELAGIMSSLGCKRAYNLDGGASAGMYFQDRMYSRPSGEGGRAVSDILYLKELE